MKQIRFQPAGTTPETTRRGDESSAGDRRTSRGCGIVNRIYRWTFAHGSGGSENVWLLTGRNQSRFVRKNMIFFEFDRYDRYDSNYRGSLISVYLSILYWVYVHLLSPPPSLIVLLFIWTIMNHVHIFRCRRRFHAVVNERSQKRNG